MEEMIALLDEMDVVCRRCQGSTTVRAEGEPVAV
jgi:hypothetical protein